MGGQPQTLEVTLVAVRDVVLVGGAAVEHVVVVDQLHLARLQVHVDVEIGVVGQRGRGGNGLPCRRAEPGRVGMALRGEDVLGDEADEEASGVLGERRDRVEGPRAAGLLAPGVVGQRLVQRCRQVRPLAYQVVVDRHGVGHAGETTGTGRAQAEQADQVGAVRVVVERNAAELVAAHGRIVDRLALVGDVAEDVAVLVLGPRLAEVQADAPVEEREVVVAVAGRVERGDPGEAPSVQESVHDLAELGRETVEGEVVALDRQRIGTLVLGHGERSIELGVVGGTQAQRPGLRVGDVARLATLPLVPTRAMR